MKVSENRKILILISAVILILFLALVYFMISTPGIGLGGSETTDEETLQQEYSNLNELSPGESTLSEIVDTVGEPSRTEEEEGNKTLLYYPTPFESAENVVAVENEIMQYAIEQVFGDYRGVASDYQNQYGNPDLELTSEIAGRSVWNVYLDQGLIVATSGEMINIMVYFIPQSQEEFNNGLAVELGLSPIGEGAGGEVYYGPDTLEDFEE